MPFQHDIINFFVEIITSKLVQNRILNVKHRELITNRKMATCYCCHRYKTKCSWSILSNIFGCFDIIYTRAFAQRRRVRPQNITQQILDFMQRPRLFIQAQNLVKY